MWICYIYWKNYADFWKSYEDFMLKNCYCCNMRGARNYRYRSKKVMKMHPKVVFIMSIALFFNWKYYWYFYTPFQDNGVKVKHTFQKRLWVMSCEIKALVAKLGWVDPTSLVAMNLNTLLLYFTKLSGKSLDFYLLVGTHLNREWRTEYSLTNFEDYFWTACLSYL